MKVYYYISLLLFFIGCKSEKAIDEFSTQQVDISATLQITPEFIKAGENILIEAQLSSTEFKNDWFQLHLNSTIGTRVYKAQSKQGKLTFKIPAAENELACKVWLKLVYKDQLISRDYFNILPQVASDKIVSYNGPKTLFAQDDDGSMNVSIPHDEFENPLIPRSIVNYSSSFNGQAKQSSKAFVNHLIAYKITQSRTQKGKFLIGTSAYEGYSREQELIIEPVMPHDLKIEVIKFYPFADSRQFVHLRSKVIKDKLNNIVTDGTIVNFVIYEKSELVASYQAFTISGVANVFIENPTTKRSWQVFASLYGSAVSNPINLNFDKNVKTFKVIQEANTNHIIIGPVFGNLGQMVPDGTPVTITLLDQKYTDLQYIESGKLNYAFPFDWTVSYPAKVQINIGGQKQNIIIERE